MSSRKEVEELVRALRGDSIRPEDRWHVVSSDGQRTSDDSSDVLWNSDKPHSWMELELPKPKSIYIDGVWYPLPLPGRLKMFFYRLVRWLRRKRNG